VGARREAAFNAYSKDVVAALALARIRSVPSAALHSAGGGHRLGGHMRTALELLAHAQVPVALVEEACPWLRDLPSRVRAQVQVEALYAGYLPRQEADVRAFRRDESLTLSRDIDYAQIGGLSTEMQEKFAAARPANLGAASRIQGVTPAALAAVMAYVRQRQAACFT
jgi:tRNA uridine 5-carboxymethylaminomethyl modification enzyme